VIAASGWGKGKTASQVVAIALLILTNTLERWLPYGNLGRLALWVVMALAIVSMIDYLNHFFRTVDLGPERS
jgi:phosphatidylglycerophosphate synthase